MVAVNNTPLTIAIRWALPKDLPAILAIEKESFVDALNEVEFRNYMKRTNVVLVIAEFNRKVVGYCIYELNKTSIRIIGVASAPNFRRKGIAKQLIEQLIEKMGAAGRSRISVELRENNVSGQCFFRSCGFKAVKVMTKFYGDTDEDGYFMRYVGKGA